MTRLLVYLIGHGPSLLVLRGVRVSKIWVTEHSEPEILFEIPTDSYI